MDGLNVYDLLKYDKAVVTKVFPERNREEDAEREIRCFTLKKPLITEKNSMMAEDNVYVFEVDKAATKTEIKVQC